LGRREEELKEMSIQEVLGGFNLSKVGCPLLRHDKENCERREMRLSAMGESTVSPQSVWRRLKSPTNRRGGGN
jgi:hypothetical protein